MHIIYVYVVYMNVNFCLNFVRIRDTFRMLRQLNILIIELSYKETVCADHSKERSVSMQMYTQILCLLFRAYRLCQFFHEKAPPKLRIVWKIQNLAV